MNWNFFVYSRHTNWNNKVTRCIFITKIIYIFIDYCFVFLTYFYKKNKFIYAKTRGRRKETRNPMRDIIATIKICSSAMSSRHRGASAYGGLDKTWRGSRGFVGRHSSRSDFDGLPTAFRRRNIRRKRINRPPWRSVSNTDRRAVRLRIGLDRNGVVGRG